ncbi:MAG TPA: hypothetical protein VN605_00070 [Thermoanaerobaculia bacterium]|nr:hypothetical protein [Thermoanaerobaculia bacterium]
MSPNAKTNDETRLAEEIVSVLPAGSIVRVCSDDRQSIRFAIRAASLKLRTVVFHRASLRRLLADAARAVKIDYLRRDLLRNAQSAEQFAYPRTTRPHALSVASRLVSAN